MGEAKLRRDRRAEARAEGRPFQAIPDYRAPRYYLLSWALPTHDMDELRALREHAYFAEHGWRSDADFGVFVIEQGLDMIRAAVDVWQKQQNEKRRQAETEKAQVTLDEAVTREQAELSAAMSRYEDERVGWNDEARRAAGDPLPEQPA